MENTFKEYVTEVEKILESFHYGELVQDFAPEDVAISIVLTMKDFYNDRQSTRKCAIIIWSCTMNYQIIPRQKELTVN